MEKGGIFMWFLVLIMKLNSRIFWDFWLCFEGCLVFVKKKGKRMMIYMVLVLF